MLGVDEVIVEFTPMENDVIHHGVPLRDQGNPLRSPGGKNMICRTKLGELENALAAPTIPTSKTWKEYQKHGGPETTKLYDPDATSPEPSGVLQPFASRILMKIVYAARMCRCDLLRAVCWLASCTTKWTHQCGRRRIMQ
jgi:hypothetical protein